MQTTVPRVLAAPAKSPAWHRALRRRFGPWAVVTGASDGIGREAAVELAAAGFDLVLVARREAALRELADTLHERWGVEARVVAVDLGDEVGNEILLSACSGLDVGLFVAAAGFGTSGPFVEGRLADELAMIDVNCRAVVQATHAFAARFRSRGRGGIVLLSSLVAFQGVPRAATYAATKAFIQSLAEALRVELRPYGVEVLASAPGPVHSGFAARAGMTMTQAASPRTAAVGTLRALGRSGLVHPGWLAKALEALLVALPRALRVRVMAKVMAGMTAGRA